MSSASITPRKRWVLLREDQTVAALQKRRSLPELPVLARSPALRNISFWKFLVEQNAIGGHPAQRCNDIRHALLLRRAGILGISGITLTNAVILHSSDNLKRHGAWTTINF
jgi:hypothetical protein